MRRLLPFLTAAFAITTACTSDATGPTGSITGTYSLRTINGSSLPYQVNSSTIIQREVLTLNADGTYNDVASFSNGSSFTEVGYYSQFNNAITFTDQTDNITYQGSISGSVLTEITGNVTAAYQKN